MEPEDEEGLCAPEEPVVKKRRKKQKKAVQENFKPLPEEAKKGYSPEIIEELQLAYNILQTIMGISKIQPFLDRPNENLFGMVSYYNIIRKPMWLLEVERKLLNREYEDIAGFVADIRLILENCYRFWGPSHKFCRKALFIEHKLEMKLNQLPEAIQEKCVDPQLAEIVVVKTENADDEFCDEPPQQDLCVTLKKGFESKILNRVLDYDEPLDSEDIEEQNRKEAEMLYWESEHLVNAIHKDQIKAMWQLAEIGSFLKLTFEALNVEEITQYEVERMLLMPKESTTLATLMTSMLSPQVMRSQLDDKPVMPYSIWTSRLKKRIDYWLSVFYKSGDEVEAFSTCGVEPAFWPCVNLMNPLENNDFHEIPFYQRVWIFKSLCNHLMHSDKPIQDILFDEANTKDLRPIRIGGDKIGNIYFRIPFFREIRVYKQARLPHKTVDNDDFLSSLMESTNDVHFNEDEKELEFLPTKSDCFMVADSIDSLAEFSQKLKDRKQLVLARNFSKQLKLVKNERKSIEGLIALYTQWHEYQNRSQEYFDHILNLWRSSEKQPEVFDSRVDPQKIKAENEELGKRPRKRNQKFDFLTLRGTDSSEESSDFEGSDVSDWESTYRHKKKKKLFKKKRAKRASSEPRSDTSDDLSKHECSSISIQEVVTLKTEFEEDIKPDIELLNCQNENGSVISYEEETRDNPEVAPFVMNSIPLNSVNSCSSVSSSVSPASTPSSVPPDCLTVPVIKKEKDDVIYISSDEEKVSVKPVPSVQPLRNKVNNGIPVPKVLPVVEVPIRTPSPQQSLVMTRNVPKPLQQTVQAGVAQSNPHLPQSVLLPIPQPKPPQPVRQPIPHPQTTQRIPVSPRSTPMPMPIPAPAQTRQMPLPIPEPAMPQPIVEPAMPQPIASPQTPSRATVWSSPKSALSSPRVRGLSPRLRSPLSSPNVRTPSPRVSPSPLRSALSPIRPVRNTAVRNLFPQTSSVPTVEGVFEIGQKPDGSYGYHVRLPDGGIINMSRGEIDDIRRKNNGVLPVKIEVPLTKNKKF